MNEGPLLSIITPVYNGEKYLVETINSVLTTQPIISFEYLVINDGSTDASLSIIQTYKQRIIVMDQDNKGESETVNRGLKNAKGKYILVLNADDPLLTWDLIRESISILENDQSIIAVYPDWKIIDDLGATVRSISLPEYSDDIMIGLNRCLPGPGVVFRRDAALRIGGRKSKWKYVGDFDFWLRMSREGELRHLPGVFAQWRESSDSTSISQRGLTMANERIQVIQEFLSDNNVDRALYRKSLGNSYCVAARLVFFDSKIKGKRLLMRAFILRKGWPEEAKVAIVLYIFFLPLSQKLIQMFPGIKRWITKTR